MEKSQDLQVIFNSHAPRGLRRIVLWGTVPHLVDVVRAIVRTVGFGWVLLIAISGTGNDKTLHAFWGA